MSTLNTTLRAKRRQFLKLSGLTTVGLLFAPFVSASGILTVHANKAVKHYQGTADGKIFLSTDYGKTWNKIVDFGKDFNIQKLVSNGQGSVIAYLKMGNRQFWLQSQNDATWFTSNYVAPAVGVIP
ncbi:MAG: twin-arginine translocation signal domain-containing protein [Methylococcaceae bacterium]|nr:twin-arginine translocation signal domain-containing protein [Methylococcaceae bacterium]